ncbi:agmatinase [Terrihabitans soli]|uniref:Agmatinase n=1 Tax=Terrihabitans soli TaxID=708113 RepID=A0A6S6QSG9_9HYPH|nr:agmatinase [Terrihabitans soli]BCJ90887.1 agmatinase [Terrihabitans soli]
MSHDPLSPRPTDRALDPSFRHGQSTEPNYSGVVSFLRRTYARDATGFDVAIWGVPFDTSVSNRPGARFGARALREASTILDGDPVYPFGLDIFEKMSVCDTGDAVADYGYPQEAPAAIEAQAAARYATGAHLVSLGGDHFITLPILRALTKKIGGPVALIQFDAHQDTWDDEDGRIDHGTFVTTAVKEGLILPEKSIQVGVRTHAPKDYGITVLNGFETAKLGPEAVAARILSHVGTVPAYITFDIDALDPAFAPGTGTPVSGGLSSREALSVLRGLESLNLKGFDVVEVSPPYDHAGITALAGATLAQYYLGLLAARKNAGAVIRP